MLTEVELLDSKSEATMTSPAAAPGSLNRADPALKSYV
jgi:hypothetical protein